MRKLKIVLNLFLIMTILFVNSCKKSDDNNSTPSVTDTKKSISKKWIITNKKSTNSSDYLWFEFNLDNTYIIAKTDKTFLSGNYTLSDDAKTITLVNYGVMTINKVSDSEFAFSIKLNSSSNTVTLSATPAPTTATSTKTDLFCRNWNLDKDLHLNTSTNKYDTTSYPNQNTTKLAVIFSKYGTYFVTNVGKDGTKYLNRKWQWKDQTEKVICYGDTTCNCNGKNEVTIVDVTSTSLKMDEKGDIFLLSPIKSTKSVQTISNAIEIKRTANLFDLK